MEIYTNIIGFHLYTGRYTVIGSGPDCKSGVFGFWEFKSLSSHDKNIADYAGSVPHESHKLESWVQLPDPQLWTYSSIGRAHDC